MTAGSWRWPRCFHIWGTCRCRTSSRKLARGRELNAEESDRVRNATRAASRLIARVPRLEPVSAILTELNDPVAETDPLVPSSADPLHLQVLRLAMDAERLEEQGLRNHAVIEALQASGDYPENLLNGLRRTQKEQHTTLERAEIPVAGLEVGMVLDDDVRTTRDVLIGPRGCEVTLSFIEHIGHFIQELPPTLFVMRQSSDSEPETAVLDMKVS
jgi:hypothetical protein